MRPRRTWHRYTVWLYYHDPSQVGTPWHDQLVGASIIMRTPRWSPVCNLASRIIRQIPFGSWACVAWWTVLHHDRPLPPVFDPRRTGNAHASIPSARVRLQRSALAFPPTLEREH